MLIIVAVAACFLAFANGANDNSKGVATLVAANLLNVRSALRYAAVATVLGSFAAIFLAGELVQKFSGKGLVDGDILASPAFLASVGVAAAVTVLLATRIGMPISTTHSMVGGLVGVGLSANALHVSAVLDAFVKPLVLAPLIALAAAAVLYVIFRRTRLAMGVGRNTCVCIDQEYHPVNVTADGSLLVAATGLRLSPEHDSTKCFEKYDGRVAGVDAQRVLDWSHLFTAGATSFARGLNDTPKIAALLIAASAMTRAPSLVVIGVAIVIGGMIAARRVAETMSHRITGMNDGQAFTANLVTAFLVVIASKFGVPVSTTHVSCGSLFGIGLVNRQAHWQVVGQIVLAWITTLPVAVAIGWIAWRWLGA